MILASHSGHKFCPENGPMNTRSDQFSNGHCMYLYKMSTTYSPINHGYPQGGGGGRRAFAPTPHSLEKNAFDLDILGFSKNFT